MEKIKGMKKLALFFLIIMAGVCIGKVPSDVYAASDVIGDANDDKVFDVGDLTRVKRAVASTEEVVISKDNADLNNDGAIDEKDLVHCREFLVKGYSTVHGTYTYTSGTYDNGELKNAGDPVKVNIADYVATVDTAAQTYEAVVANGTYDVALSSARFHGKSMTDVKVAGNTAVEECSFSVPNLTPTTFFGYNQDGHDYAVWEKQNVSIEGVNATEGFVATVKMRPYDGMWYRGAFGVTVKDKTFYIMPYYVGKKASIYVGTDLGLDNDTVGKKLVGETGQTWETKSEPCTLKVIYLDGTYYVSLKVEGCEVEPKMLLINAQTSGLSADYFATGERTIQLGALKNNLVYYDELSYQLGDKAVEEALREMDLCVVKGSYAYASGTYQDQTYRNAEDKVTVKIGEHAAVVDQNTQTYQALVPSESYDITLTSSQFKDVKIQRVAIRGTTEVEEATFVIPRLTPDGDFGYGTSGHDYAVYKGKSVSVAGMKANEGFVATVKMNPNGGVFYRGGFGVTVGEKTLYIKPYYGGGKVKIYIGASLAPGNSSGVSGVEVGETRQTYNPNTKADPCTLKVIYLDGTYYVSLKVDGCDTKEETFVISKDTQPKLFDANNAFYGSSERTFRLSGFTDAYIPFYDGLHYELGDEAAKAALETVTEYSIPTLPITTKSTYVDTGIVAKEGFVMSFSMSKYASDDVWNPAGVIFAYSSAERNFIGIGAKDSGMPYIVGKKWGAKNNFASAPGNYTYGNTIQIVYFENVYYIIVNGAVKELRNLDSFNAGKDGALGEHFFTSHDRRIGFITSEKTTAQFDAVSIRLGDEAAKAVLDSLESSTQE